jgi:hypothetical protein
MIKHCVLMLSLMTLPIFGKNYENVEEYLEEQKAEDQACIRNNICGTEIIVEKKGFWPMGYLLSCPDAKEFMKTLMQIEDKSPYSISLLKMTKHDEEGFAERKVVEDISIEEAQKALDAFTADMNKYLAQLMEKQRQYNIKEYEKKFGFSEQNSN